MTNDTLLPFDLPAVHRKKLTVDFDGGNQSLTSGLLLLRHSERKIVVCARLAAAMPERRDNPGRVISWWRRGGLITVCDGEVGGALTERERSNYDQVAVGGSRRFTSLMNTSSKPGSWSSGCSLMNAITLR